mmetsp:Transcript_3132/g.9457  ORF Transcript_3132/g.9457 Transcript_3132/m.9457 type:complete len:234 (+) Transcript_3132:103-804(+)
MCPAAAVHARRTKNLPPPCAPLRSGRAERGSEAGEADCGDDARHERCEDPGAEDGEEQLPVQRLGHVLARDEGDADDGADAQLRRRDGPALCGGDERGERVAEFDVEAAARRDLGTIAADGAHDALAEHGQPDCDAEAGVGVEPSRRADVCGDEALPLRLPDGGDWSHFVGDIVCARRKRRERGAAYLRGAEDLFHRRVVRSRGRVRGARVVVDFAREYFDLVRPRRRVAHRR